MKVLLNNTIQKLKCPKKSEKKPAIPIIRYMLYLLIVTITITGVSLSRYATSSSQKDAGRVAGFDVSVTHTGTWSENEFEDVSNHLLNGSKVYSFRVTNNSEVAVRARVVIDGNSGTAPIVSPSGTFDIAPHSSRDNVQITVVGSAVGNLVKMHIEYEQIN